MILTTQMTQLFAVVLRRDRERVTETLLREGVMQFISTSEIDLESRSISGAAPDAVLTELSDMRKRIDGILHTIGAVPAAPRETDLKNRVAINLAKEEALLDKIDGERDSIRERQRSLQQEILKIEDLQRQVDLYGVDLGGLKAPGRQSMLSMQTGKLSAAGAKRFEEALKGLPALHMLLGQQDGVAHYLLLSMKRDQEQIERILSSVGWAKVELPQELLSARKDLAGELKEKLQKLTEEQKKLQVRVTELIRKEEPRLKALWVNLRIQELCGKIQASFASSARTVIFAGWLASSTKERLNAKIREACEGRCYLEWHDANHADTVAADVPVQFNNPKVLAPFQMLVSNFGIPQYGTIDPTPFVMPIYLIMFGLMFADAGQGLVLGLIGAVNAYLVRNDPAKRSIYNLSWLITWCGFSAIVFGMLFGSYFGKPLIKPLWFDYHGIVSGHAHTTSVISDVYDILAITIYFGITVITLGLLFNWFNLIRTRQWAELVFNKGGILGGWIYGGGVYVASYMVHHDYKGFPPGNTLFLLVGLPALLLLIKEPYHHLTHGRTHDEKGRSLISTGMTILMEWVVELLEIFSGYLSNTLSFMRVAGLGIAHVCLMMSFFTLASMTSGVFSLVILVLGNVLVIGLEGLSAAIQALRLNYYEFFTKFFHGTGKLYTPISLNSEG
jgi:V/A-type H+-transporting ATPase subunit I